MAIVKPFRCIRPNADVVSEVAALPYDVYNRTEAYEITKKNPRSFLNIDRPETQFSQDVDMYDDRVYKKASELLNLWIGNGTFIEEESKQYFVYELTMDGRSQTGLVACSSIDDYQEGIIKKHENTREEKETDRIRHVDTTNAQTGPIFLAYRGNQTIHELIETAKKKMPLYDFIARDGVMHRVWKISGEDTSAQLEAAFAQIPNTYIADGHHRAASAVKVGLKRRQENREHKKEEAYDYFLSVLFPDDQLMILPYNRVVKDLNGLTIEQFLEQISQKFDIVCLGKKPFAPEKKGTFGLYLGEQWYQMTAKEALLCDDPVEGLDVSILQNHLLDPVLGIKDPRTDKRIDFIGGIRGLEELEKRVLEDMKVAFSMYPTSIEELFAVADANRLMPPKSTWFEPKLRSGLFIHKLSQ